jgi:hypothetical protein
VTCLQWELGGLSCLAPQLSPPPRRCGKPRLGTLDPWSRRPDTSDPKEIHLAPSLYHQTSLQLAASRPPTGARHLHSTTASTQVLARDGTSPARHPDGRERCSVSPFSDFKTLATRPLEPHEAARELPPADDGQE